MDTATRDESMESGAEQHGSSLEEKMSPTKAATTTTALSSAASSPNSIDSPKSTCPLKEPETMTISTFIDVSTISDINSNPIISTISDTSKIHNSDNVEPVDVDANSQLPTQDINQVDPDSYNHQCYICDKIFSANSNLNRHLRNIHQQNVSSPYNNVKCALCDNVFSSSSLYNSHLEKDHKVEIHVENYRFPTFNDFIDWKQAIERESMSQFIKSRGVKRTDDLQKIYYSCNRSGYYISKARTRKALKKQGSRKINGRCPASMNVTINIEDDCVDVKYVKSHVGHDFELKHLDLSDRDRDLIVQKLAQGVPKKDIIKQIRDSVDDTNNPSRLHLTTTKDIHNIINSLNLDSKLIRHNYDLVNVEAWISEMKEFNEYSSVIFYKSQSETMERFPSLKEDDFMLVIMKDGQREILKKRGHICIIIDSTHNVHCEYLHLAIVSVIDDNGKGFPIAFLYSTRTDLEILEVFFTIIKDKVGHIATKMLIADELQDFYVAWAQVMAKPAFNLLAPWTVQDSWIKKFDLVTSRDKLRKLKKDLRLLLVETDRTKFSKILKTTIDQQKQDPQMKEFVEFFSDNFIQNIDTWSNCLRKEQSGPSNLHLLTLHEKFKNAYKEGKNSKKLCKSISGLMSLFEDDQFNRLVALEEASKTKMKSVINRHKKSVETRVLVYEIAVERRYWLVPSDNISEHYFEVLQQDIKSEDCPCEIKCNACRSCVHCYRCNCLDYTINLNMCKHIHRVCCPENDHPTVGTIAHINLHSSSKAYNLPMIAQNDEIDATLINGNETIELIVHELQTQNETLSEQLQLEKQHKQQLESAYELQQQQNRELLAKIQELEKSTLMNENSNQQE